ncbi:uncharacterized protein BP5553_03122 [Venustampulla echinocandica]|uniref:Uncharacterized protein n=1 Tax=Venustampulla echinocandica TaxID=2656787 RepID=A0A370TTC4_9HELO|nr:uncharacterized protein BP5553_03122 [Venustampulla echinocandica]RDL38782.1 hypothetical protein BP5553_03122 [Venustampulla echinocandica]
MAYLSSAGPRPTSNSTRASNSEATKILPNTLYLTFNAPQVDEYHRGLFLTYPKSTTSGILVHAIYVDSKWGLEKRVTKDISSAKSLVLLYRIHTFDDSTASNVDKQFCDIEQVLERVPMGSEVRENKGKKGNPALGGYDCVIWTGDAIRALAREGFVDLRGRSVEQIMDESRSLAGPQDAKTMVGKDFGGLKVVV